jgi:hypothetical protein
MVTLPAIHSTHAEQPGEFPLRYPGGGDVTCRLHLAPSLGKRGKVGPRHNGWSETQPRLAYRVPHTREKALAQGAGGKMVLGDTSSLTSTMIRK